MKRRAACWCLVIAWAGRIQIIEYLLQKRGALLLLSDSFSLRGVCRIPRNPYTRDKPHRLPRTRVSSHTGFCGIIATTGLNIRIMMVCTQESLNVVTGSEICCSTFAAITPPQRLPPLFFSFFMRRNIHEPQKAKVQEGVQKCGFIIYCCLVHYFDRGGATEFEETQ